MAVQMTKVFFSDLYDEDGEAVEIPEEEVQREILEWKGQRLNLVLNRSQVEKLDSLLRTNINFDGAEEAEAPSRRSSGPRKPSGSLLSGAEKPVARLWIQEQYKEREIGDRGRLPRDLEQAWIDAGKPRP